MEIDNNYNGTEIVGYIVTNKINNNVIFLPANGYFRFNHLNEINDNGYYWSNSLYMSNQTDAQRMCFNSDHISKNNAYRHFRNSIRPVYKKTKLL